MTKQGEDTAKIAKAVTKTDRNIRLYPDSSLGNDQQEGTETQTKTVRKIRNQN